MELNKTKIEEQRILAVDLGINTDATCSVMCIDGTILAREFVNFASDKDQLYHTLNKIKKFNRSMVLIIQQNYGGMQNFIMKNLLERLQMRLLILLLSMTVTLLYLNILILRARRKVLKSRSYRCGRKILSRK